MQYLRVLSGCVQQNHEEKQFEFRKQRIKKSRKPLYSEYFWKCRIFSIMKATVLGQFLSPRLNLPLLDKSRMSKWLLRHWVEGLLSKDIVAVGEYLQTWKLKFSTTKTMSAAFRLNNKEATHELKVLVLKWGYNRLNFANAANVLRKIHNLWWCYRGIPFRTTVE